MGMWDPTCNVPGVDHVGCKADGINEECRFCGGGDYISCHECIFKDKPEVAYVWDNRCVPAVYTKGCLADGIHFQCRFCGSDDFAPCPTTTSTVTTKSTQSTETTTQDVDAIGTSPEGDPDVLSGACPCNGRVQTVFSIIVMMVVVSGATLSL